MATYKTYSQIARSMVDRLRLVQPGLDTKPGSVSRDLFIDLQADELQKLYNLISLVSDKQSFATASGSDLDKLARNFGFSRKRGSTSSGTVVFSLDEISIDYEIAEGTIVSTRSGVSFRTIGNYRFLANQKNVYSANASRIQKQLNIAGSASGFALEVPVEAVTPGISGNVGSYQIISQSAPFNFSITNISSMSGGSDQESDSEFRRRFLSSFSASGVGTATGYTNSVLTLNDVLDVLVVEPGSTLMLRDGTEIVEGDLNERRISYSGTGGKVDVYVLGSRNEEISESFIFFNKSPNGDISHESNDFILGNFEQDSTLTSQERRVAAFQSGNIPFQPVSSIVSLSGEDSGPLTEGETFELVKDINSDTGGSPFGFDKIRFLNNFKTVSEESIVKGRFNSDDALDFSDVISSSLIFQDISIENENSKVNVSDRRFIVLNHSRVKNVLSVINDTTGENYTIDNLFLDEGVNDSGVIQISGKKLPSITDRLKVNYVWNKKYDEYLDYTIDSSSVSWKDSFNKETEGSLVRDSSAYYIQTSDAISNVNDVIIYSEQSSIVQSQQGALFCDVSNAVKNVYKIIVDGVDVINTKEKDFSFDGTRIYFSSDSGVKSGESCSVIYNYSSVYSFDNVSGFFQEKKIFLPEDSLFDPVLLGELNQFFSSGMSPIINYDVFSESMIPQVSINSLPIYSSSSSDRFFDVSQNNILNSYKPSEYSSGYNRYSPTKVRVRAESIVSQGEIKISGTTLKRYDISTEISRIYDGTKFDLSSIINEDGLAKISYVMIKKEANLNGYRLKTNSYSNDGLLDSSLSPYEFYLANNTYNSFEYSDGDIVSIVAYSYKNSDSESLYFYEDSALETEKIFLSISSISVSSGFLNSGSIVGNITVEFANQPATGDEFFSTYKIIAPKEGERLFVSYNHNKVISDATKIIEESRPITADVLIKEASILNVNVNASIIISETFEGESESIRENVVDQISNLLSTNVLGSVIDYSDVIRAITNVTGVESADVSLFNYDGETGRRDFVRSLDNQSISPNIISVSVVSRKDFRIS